MMKPIITIILSVFALFVWADDSGQCGYDLTWTYVEETKTLTISGSGAMYTHSNLFEEYPWFYRVYDKTEKVVINDGVTTIGDGAFNLFSKLTSIEIPNSVTSIGEKAFGSCVSLTSFVLPSSVETLDKEVFYDCKNLTSISVDDANPVFDSRGGCNAIIKTANNELVLGCATTVIPDDVTRIGNRAFMGCSGLTSITIPQGIKSIGTEAFWGCSNLTSIEIPSSMNGIGQAVFSGCSSMVSVTLPNTITSIGAYAFMSCSSLKSIEIPSSVTLINIYAFNLCSSLTSVEIPGSVKELAQGAFQQCTDLQTVRIEDGATTLKNNVFKDCTSLTDLYCYSEQLPSAEESAFMNASNQATLHVPTLALEAYKSTTPWSKFQSIVALTNEETKIEETLSDSLSIGRGIYNLQGQRVSVNSVFSAPSVLPKGVYIVDGKKLWVK